MERTLILIKPDGVARGLVGQIVARIEDKGYRIDALNLRMATSEELAAHYAEHEGKPFYQPLVDFMAEGPIVSIIASGQGVDRKSTRLNSSHVSMSYAVFCF